VLAINIAAWSGMFCFLAGKQINRKHPSPKVDWTDRGDFLKLLFLFIAIGLAQSVYQFYHIWLCSSFSNDPSKLGRYNGYISALRMSGLAAAFGLDSHKVSFMVEAEVYFIILIVGAVLSLISAYKYTKDTNYGSEDAVIDPHGSTADIDDSVRSSSDSREEVYSIRPQKV